MASAKRRYVALQNTVQRRKRCRRSPVTDRWQKSSATRNKRISGDSPRRPSERCRTKIEHRVSNLSPVSQSVAENSYLLNGLRGAVLNQGLIFSAPASWRANARQVLGHSEAGLPITDN